MTDIQDYAAGFAEEPGYLDFARLGPISDAVVAELNGQQHLLSRARFGSLDQLEEHDQRLRTVIGELTGFRADQVVAQPNTTSGMTHVAYGLSGGVLISPAEFPSSTVAVARAAQALGHVTPIWLGTDYGRVTPASIREQLTSTTTAVIVSAVDYRTGFRADLDGIRQVIGDRLLIVDAIQGFGVIDAPWHLADVVVSGGQKWMRAGWGTGFMAMSDRAVERIAPLLSGWVGFDEEAGQEIPAPRKAASAFSLSNPDRVAEARLAAAAESALAVGVAQIEATISERIERVIDLADEFAIPVASSRDPRERAGIVVLTPPTGQLTVLTASLFNHGVTVTSRDQSVRISAHASTDEETFGMLRGAFMSYATATGAY